MSIGVYLRTCSYLTTIAVLTLIGIIPAVIIASLPESIRFRIKIFYWLEYWFFSLILKSLWVPVIYKGLENIPSEPVIFAANHQSSLDIPSLGSLTKGRENIWLIWHMLSTYPVFGYIVQRMNVMVDTTTSMKAARSLFQAYELLIDNHRDLMIFPEGGRFTDGKVHEFFAGFAMLAKKTQRPVIPVLLKNTSKVCAPKTIWINYAPIEIHIGKSFIYEENETAQQFLDRVHNWFVVTNGS